MRCSGMRKKRMSIESLPDADDIVRPRRPPRRGGFRVHRGQAAPDADLAQPAPDGPAEAWPLHSMGAVTASVAVASVAAGWMLATVIWTGPVLMAGQWLARRAGPFGEA